MKRRHGHMLLWAGFFGAAMTTLYRAQDVPWSFYVLWLAVGVAGVWILRATAHDEASHEHKVSADVEAMRGALDTLTGRLDEMLAGRDKIGVYDVHVTIDDTLVADLARFADARESMIPLWGLNAYADVMTRFAGAERMINRAWSASADGYVDEVWKSLERAGTLMHEARDSFARSEREGGA